MYGYTNMPLEDRMEMEIEQFGMIQKDDKGILKLDAKFSEHASRMGFKVCETNRPPLFCY